MPYQDLAATELVRACVDSADPAVWEEFVRRFQPTIAGVALRTARRWGESSPLVLEDLVQETFVKICADRRRLLRDFEPHHPEAFFGYLKVVTARVVHDYFKRTHAAKRASEEGTQSLSGLIQQDPPDPGASRQIEQATLLGEIERRLEELSLGQTGERDRRIFRLYYRAGMSASTIAGLPGMNLTVKGVESTIFRVTRMLRESLAESGSAAIAPGESLSRD